jgi:hypothetical protein
MTNMQIPVGLWREARDDGLGCAIGQVTADTFADEIARFGRRFAVDIGFGHKILLVQLSGASRQPMRRHPGASGSMSAKYAGKVKAKGDALSCAHK